MASLRSSFRFGASLTAMGIAGLAQVAVAQDAPTRGSLNAAQPPNRVSMATISL